MLGLGEVGTNMDLHRYLGLSKTKYLVGYSVWQIFKPLPLNSITFLKGSSKWVKFILILPILVGLRHLGYNKDH